MAFTDLQLLRIQLADPYKDAFDKQFGDGETLNYQLAHKNIKDDSYEVAVADVEQTEEADFEIDQDTGLITFVEAPADEAEIEVKYQFSAFSDEELNNFLTLDGNIPAVVVRCIDILLFDSAKRFDYTSGQTELKPSQVFAHLKELRKIMEKEAGKLSSGGGVTMASRTERHYETQVSSQTDLSRADLGQNE